MPRPLRVFLCHASQDKPTVWKLHRYLKQHGIKPWLDQEDLLPGEDWEVEIPKALFASDVILVCLSKNSVNKEGFVQKEITFALDKAMEKPEGTIFIIPVKLEDCEIPRRLTRYQWVDLSRAEGRKRLLMGLNKRVTELGTDVSPVILDDTRRITQPKTPKPETRKPEEQIVFVPVKEEAKEEPKKEIQAKPFTKFLDPSSLSPNEKSTLDPNVGRVSNPTEPLVPKKHQAKSLTYNFLGIALLVLILGGFGLNYLINNLPIATITASATNTVTPKPTTFTSVPFTATPQPTETLTPKPIKTPSPTPTLGIGSTIVSEKDGMTLLYVPAGIFIMGSDNGDLNEKPIHQVDLDAFWIDQTEVTNEMYARCVVYGACKEPENKSSFTRSSYYGNSEFDNYPVINVDWNKANTYCSWAGRRLPTEAEWEKSARGADLRIYPWGNVFDCKKGNFDDETQAHTYVVPGGKNCDGYPDTAPVGVFTDGISPYGALDMAGNVWEWVNDRFSETYYQDSLMSNPLGPNSGEFRVLRGGSLYGNVYGTRSANRYRYSDSVTEFDIGFRCALSP